MKIESSQFKNSTPVGKARFEKRFKSHEDVFVQPSEEGRSIPFNIDNVSPEYIEYLEHKRQRETPEHAGEQSDIGGVDDDLKGGSEIADGSEMAENRREGDVTHEDVDGGHLNEEEGHERYENDAPEPESSQEEAEVGKESEEFFSQEGTVEESPRSEPEVEVESVRSGGELEYRDTVPKESLSDTLPEVPKEEPMVHDTVPRESLPETLGDIEEPTEQTEREEPSGWGHFIEDEENEVMKEVEQTTVVEPDAVEEPTEQLEPFVLTPEDRVGSHVVEGLHGTSKYEAGEVNRNSFLAYRKITETPSYIDESNVVPVPERHVAAEDEKKAEQPVFQTEAKVPEPATPPPQPEKDAAPEVTEPAGVSAEKADEENGVPHEAVVSISERLNQFKTVKDDTAVDTTSDNRPPKQAGSIGALEVSKLGVENSSITEENHDETAQSETRPKPPAREIALAAIRSPEVAQDLAETRQVIEGLRQKEVLPEKVNVQELLAPLVSLEQTLHEMRTAYPKNYAAEPRVNFMDGAYVLRDVVNTAIEAGKSKEEITELAAPHYEKLEALYQAIRTIEDSEEPAVDSGSAESQVDTTAGTAETKENTVPKSRSVTPKPIVRIIKPTLVSATREPIPVAPSTEAAAAADSTEYAIDLPEGANDVEFRAAYLTAVSDIKEEAEALTIDEGQDDMVDLRTKVIALANQVEQLLNIGISEAADAGKVRFLLPFRVTINNEYEKLRDTWEELTKATKEAGTEVAEDGPAVDGFALRRDTYKILNDIEARLNESRESTPPEQFEAVKRAQVRKRNQELRSVLGEGVKNEVPSYSAAEAASLTQKREDIVAQAEKVLKDESSRTAEKRFVGNDEPELPFAEPDFANRAGIDRQAGRTEVAAVSDEKRAEVFKEVEKRMQEDLSRMFAGGLKSKEWARGGIVTRAIAEQRVDDFLRTKLPTDPARAWVAALQEQAGANAPRIEPAMKMATYVPALYEALVRHEQGLPPAGNAPQAPKRV